LKKQDSFERPGLDARNAVMTDTSFLLQFAPQCWITFPGKGQNYVVLTFFCVIKAALPGENAMRSSKQQPSLCILLIVSLLMTRIPTKATKLHCYYYAHILPYIPRFSWFMSILFFVFSLIRYIHIYFCFAWPTVCRSPTVILLLVIISSLWNWNIVQIHDFVLERNNSMKSYII